MAEINDIMAPIAAPELSSSEYGKNVKEQFENINNNFHKLANREFVKGNDGSGLERVPIFLDLGDPDGSAIISKLRWAITSKFSETELADIDSIKFWESMKGTYVYLYRLETTGKYVFSEPYIFYDARWATPGDRDASSYADLANATGALYMVPTENGCDLSDIEFEYSDSIPAIYYDNGEFFWEINGQRTGLVARGPRGPKGSDGKIWTVRRSAGEGTGLFKVAQVLYNGNWIQPSEMPEGTIEKGDMAIIFSATGGSNADYWISDIQVNGEDYYVSCTDGNSIVSKFDANKFDEIMRTKISADQIDNLPKGIYVPIKKGAAKTDDVPVHIMFAANEDPSGAENTDLFLIPIDSINSLRGFRGETSGEGAALMMNRSINVKLNGIDNKNALYERGPRYERVATLEEQMMVLPSDIKSKIVDPSDESKLKYPMYQWDIALQGNKGEGTATNTYHIKVFTQTLHPTKEGEKSVVIYFYDETFSEAESGIPFTVIGWHDDIALNYYKTDIAAEGDAREDIIKNYHEIAALTLGYKDVNFTGDVAMTNLSISESLSTQRLNTVNITSNKAKLESLYVGSDEPTNTDGLTVEGRTNLGDDLTVAGDVEMEDLVVENIAQKIIPGTSPSVSLINGHVDMGVDHFNIANKDGGKFVDMSFGADSKTIGVASGVKLTMNDDVVISGTSGDISCKPNWSTADAVNDIKNSGSTIDKLASNISYTNSRSSQIDDNDKSSTCEYDRYVKLVDYKVFTYNVGSNGSKKHTINMNSKALAVYFWSYNRTSYSANSNLRVTYSVQLMGTKKTGGTELVADMSGKTYSWSGTYNYGSTLPGSGESAYTFLIKMPASIVFENLNNYSNIFMNLNIEFYRWSSSGNMGFTYWPVGSSYIYYVGPADMSITADHSFVSNDHVSGYWNIYYTDITNQKFRSYMCPDGAVCGYDTNHYFYIKLGSDGTVTAKRCSGGSEVDIWAPK